MNVLKRLHIFANEAMQAICACKPQYKYFKLNAVKKYGPVIKEIINNEVIYREPTEDELDNLANFELADEIAQREYFVSKDTYEINTDITMPETFISFTNKQSFIVKRPAPFSPEDFVNGNDWCTNEAERLEPVKYNEDIIFTSGTTVRALKEGEYLIPYRCVWYLFTSASADTKEINMPVDIFNCIPLYIASEILQIDYAQKAQIKRSEFEMARNGC